MEVQEIKISKIVQNKGQIVGLPSNPRQWTKADVERLAASIEETPELLDARPLIAVKQEDRYVVLGGNLRLAALKHLGRDVAPVYVLPDDTPIEKQKEIVIKDNGAFGAWDFDMLANEWDDLPLTDWGVPTWDSGAVDESALDALFQETEGGNDKDSFKIQVVVPKGFEDKQEDIIAALRVTLEEWPGCKVK